MARSGVASRRDCEKIINAGRVKVNGKVLRSPAFTVVPSDRILLDNEPIAEREPPRLWRYYKPAGLTTTHKDEEGRKTVFESLPSNLPRVISVGRLDINSEGLLLLTNDGELSRALELPSTGWVRRYRARAFGEVTQEQLDTLKDGIMIEGIPTGPIEAVLDKQQRNNAWITVSIAEGKNREVRRALDTLGLKVNRLIRISYGPFQLSTLEGGEVEEVKNRVLRDQVGHLIDIPKSRTAPGGSSRKPKGNRKAKAAARFEAPSRASGKPSSASTDTPTAPKGRGKFARTAKPAGFKTGGGKAKSGSAAPRPKGPKPKSSSANSKGGQSGGAKPSRKGWAKSSKLSAKKSPARKTGPRR